MYTEFETNRKCPTSHFITVMLGKYVLCKTERKFVVYNTVSNSVEKYTAGKEGSKGIVTIGHDMFSQRCPNLRTLQKLSRSQLELKQKWKLIHCNVR
jgi:hypothetical protein